MILDLELLNWESSALNSRPFPSLLAILYISTIEMIATSVKIFSVPCVVGIHVITRLVIICSKLTIETLEQCVKYVQS